MAPKQNSPSSRSQSSPYDFKRGAQVEINSNEEGFRGSWYHGTVLRRASSKKPSKYLVRYHKLFTDDKGKLPLEEILECGHLRPLAPKVKEGTFHFNEEVDAFYNDGWWEGVIVEERKDGKFGVFFTGSKEKIYVGKEDLRLHREWINGEWFPDVGENQVNSGIEDQTEIGDQRRDREEVVTIQQKTAPSSMNTTLQAGMAVEVSSDEPGLEGAWFPAKLIETLKNGKYLVQYTSLRTDDDSDFLKEEVDMGFVRPRPPDIAMVDRFNMLEEVDALYNDGWWVGIISKVLSKSKYRVFFKDTDEDLVFDHSDLRLHHDWIDGKWIIASEVLKP